MTTQDYSREGHPRSRAVLHQHLEPVRHAGNVSSRNRVADRGTSVLDPCDISPCLACGEPLQSWTSDLDRCRKCCYAQNAFPAVVDGYNAAYARRYQEYEQTGEALLANRWKVIDDLVCARRGDMTWPPSAYVVDVGCGVGSLLIRATTSCITMVGYEPMAALRQIATDRLGMIPVAATPTKMMEGIRAAHRANQIVIGCFFDSLEHIERPVSFLRHSTFDTIIVSVPCFPDAAPDSWSRQLLRWKHYKPEEHLHYWGLAALIQTLRNAGYIVQRANWREIELGRQDIVTVVADRTS